MSPLQARSNKLKRVFSGTNETTTAAGYSSKSSYEINKDSETGEVSGTATATTGAGYTATVTGSGTQTGGFSNCNHR